MDSSDLIKNKAAEYIIGLEKKVMCMKDNLKLEKETEKEHSGGVTEAGMKDNLETEFNLDGEFYIERVDIDNMKEIGIMVCSMEKVFNTLKMDKDMKELLNKINSTDRVYSIKMIRLFMEYGKIINYQ